jgi:hypothetical protein
MSGGAVLFMKGRGARASLPAPLAVAAGRSLHRRQERLVPLVPAGAESA